MTVYAVTFVLAIAAAWFANASWQRDGGGRIPRGATLSAIPVMVVLSVPAALRWQVGADYSAYYTNFNKYRTGFADGSFIFGEPGIRIIARIAGAFGGDGITMIGIAAVITTVLMVWTLWRWSPVFTFSIAIYFLAGPWIGAFNGVRQYLAAAVLFAGHRLIINRELWKWAAVVLVAVLFHVTALIGLLFYFVPTRRTSVKIQLLVIILGIAGMFSLEVLMDAYERISGNEGMWDTAYAHNTVNPLRVAFAFVPLTLYWILKVKDRVRAENAQFYVNILAIHAATYLAASSSALITRFAIYTGPFIAIGLVFTTWVDNWRDRWLTRTTLLLLYGLFWYTEVSTTISLSTFQWVFQRS